CFRIMTFDPRRCVDEIGETCCMALWKPICAKPFNLPEAAFSKISFIATSHHPSDHFLAKLMDVADIAERCHGTAQTVRLISSEFGGLDRDPHCLLLKKRNTQSLFEYSFELTRVTVLWRRRRVDNCVRIFSPL